MFNNLVKILVLPIAILIFANTEVLAKAELNLDYCEYTEHNTANERFAWKFCCLCEDCDYPPNQRIGWFVNENNKTCKDLDSEFIRTLPPQSETCFEQQNQFRDTCCDLTCKPKEIEQTWDPVIPPMMPGDEPLCHLCSNGQFPTKPYTITTIAGIVGHPTCEDLYWMGRTGNMPLATCYPVQKFGHTPCGCATPLKPHQGNEPLCNLCRNGTYPLRPKIRINQLPNAPSCKKLYWHGRAGRIEPSICHQLQTNAQEPCGCLPD